MLIPRFDLELPGINNDMCDEILNLREHHGNITVQDSARVKSLILTPELLDVVDFEPYCREGQDTSYGIPSDTLMPILSQVNDNIANATLTGPQRYEQPQNIPQRWVGMMMMMLGQKGGVVLWDRSSLDVSSYSHHRVRPTSHHSIVIQLRKLYHKIDGPLLLILAISHMTTQAISHMITQVISHMTTLVLSHMTTGQQWF